MALSLFGESLHLHHFATEQDVAEEFFILLSEARELYLQDVIVDGKRYDRYVDDFINRHRYIDCNHAVCRNCHEMNIHIVKGLLTGYAHLINCLLYTSRLKACPISVRYAPTRHYSAVWPCMETGLKTLGKTLKNGSNK